MCKYYFVCLLFILFSGCKKEEENLAAYSNVMECRLPVKKKSIPFTYKKMEIRRIHLNIEVNNFDKAISTVSEIIKKSSGYIKDSDLDINSDETKSGNITSFIPRDKLNYVLNKIKRDVGRVKSESINTEDVTEDYIDENARLINKRKAETQYQILLKKATKVEDMLKIEQALSEVRSEIESIEGKMKYLETQTSMSSVSLYLYEPNNENTPEMLNLFTTFTNSFKHGVNGFVLVLGAVIVFSISIIPLLPLLVLLWKWIRLKYRKYIEKKSQLIGNSIKS